MTIPKRLYKFRVWGDERHQRMITTNQIFLASPRSFGDPFDCKLPIRFEKMHLSVKISRWERLVKQEEPDLESREIWKKVRGKIKELKRPEKVTEAHQQQLKYIEEKFGVFSMTATCKNIVMWSHYADMHRGFCVGFDFPALDAFCREGAETTGTVLDTQEVDYVSEYPDIVPGEDNAGEENAAEDNVGDMLKKVLITKSRDWFYEAEYRLLVYGYTNLPINLPKGIIKEVILGCEIDQQTDKLEIIDALQAKRDRSITLFQAKKKDFQYGLDFEEVSY